MSQYSKGSLGNSKGKDRQQVENPPEIIEIAKKV